MANEFDVLLSVGRTGQCWDNALAEHFFATIKRELLDTKAWPSRTLARTTIFDFIESWYNLHPSGTHTARLLTQAQDVDVACVQRCCGSVSRYIRSRRRSEQWALESHPQLAVSTHQDIRAVSPVVAGRQVEGARYVQITQHQPSGQEDP
ncbi:integrase core domain-containing protein [Streptomyces atratus]|uniref:integrase core domain-containing protein n=1 Tax=Streptomyces atratus TaxID=1893 RepID=UPI00130079B4